MAELSVEQRDFLLPQAYNAALRAAHALLEIYHGGADYDIGTKSDHTPITIADRRAHEIIKSHLGQTRIPLMSEEGREILYAERYAWDLFWMVDPLDGTKEFIKGNGEFTVNIALMVDNVPELGIIYVPYINKMYFAERRLGSFLKIGVEPDAAAGLTMAQIMEGALPLPLRDRCNVPLRIAVSRTHRTRQTNAHIALMQTAYPGAEIVEQGSSYKFCMLAEGVVDYYARLTDTYEWDTAAGELILEMAGGATRSFENGHNLQYNKENLVNPSFVCRSKHMPEAPYNKMPG